MKVKTILETGALMTVGMLLIGVGVMKAQENPAATETGTVVTVATSLNVTNTVTTAVGTSAAPTDVAGVTTPPAPPVATTLETNPQPENPGAILPVAAISNAPGEINITPVSLPAIPSTNIPVPVTAIETGTSTVTVTVEHQESNTNGSMELNVPPLAVATSTTTTVSVSVAVKTEEANTNASIEILAPATQIAVPKLAVATNAQEEAKTNAETKANGERETVAFATDKGDIPGAQAVTNALNENLISITLDDVEMADVVRMFTRISGANIIASPSNLTGRVTVNLADVEWKPALMSILDMNNLDLVEKTPGSGVYSIVAKIPGAPAQMVVETIFLKYASVSNVLPVVSSMVSDVKGTVTAFPSKNALVIRTTDPNLAEIKKIISNIDKMRDQVFIEAKFVELTDEAIQDLGINWQSLQGYQLHASSLNYSYNQQNNWNNSVNNTQTKFDNVLNQNGVYKAYDQNGQQLPGSSLATGSAAAPGGPVAPTVLATGGGLPTYATVNQEDKGNNLESVVNNTFTKTIAQVESAVLSADDFNMVLAALKQQNGVSIVSNPKILVANEQRADILIGQVRRPFIASVTPGQQGIAPVVTYNPGDPVKTGVLLSVTPTINTESNITVKIEPQLTSIAGEDIAPNSQTYPIISTKFISTVFCLENGKTAAIGGLTQATDNDSGSKIPLLGDIPLIGKYLFSWSHKDKKQDETIIFVTVNMATPESIKSGDGLPEDTQLTQKHVIYSEVRRRQYQAELKELKEASDTTADTAQAMKVKERLLRRDN